MEKYNFSMRNVLLMLQYSMFFFIICFAFPFKSLSIIQPGLDIISGNSTTFKNLYSTQIYKTHMIGTFKRLPLNTSLFYSVELYFPANNTHSQKYITLSTNISTPYHLIRS